MARTRRWAHDILKFKELPKDSFTCSSKTFLQLPWLFLFNRNESTPLIPEASSARKNFNHVLGWSRDQLQWRAIPFEPEHHIFLFSDTLSNGLCRDVVIHFFAVDIKQYVAWKDVLRCYTAWLNGRDDDVRSLELKAIISGKPSLLNQLPSSPQLSQLEGLLAI
uniref:Uncharacterized protein n=1 Tax=Meloidogyne incognita TaxID=6306 RepID=A0A914LQ49_MELIC